MIGRKVWYDIKYKVEGSDVVLTVSTTRPDTQFGSTFVVVSPDGDAIKQLLPIIPEEKLKKLKNILQEV